MPLDDAKKSTLLRYAIPLGLLALALIAGLAVYGWRSSTGRISFDGILANNDYLLVAGQSGRAAAVEVRPGDIVINGQPLLRFDNSGLRKTLEQERQKLIQLARMLPPEHIRLPDPDDPAVGNETLTRRLARKGAAEREAVRSLQSASDTEARASVAYSRASILYSQGKVSRGELLKAESEVNEAKNRLAAARKRQENISNQRATAETAIRRVLEFHAASGANKIPLQQRLDNYETQRKHVEQLARAVSVAYLAAPFEGKILEVLVRSGEELSQETPCFVLQPSAMPLMLSCSLEAAETLKLAEGQQCLVSFPDYSKEAFEGYVAGMEAGSDPAWREVKVGVIRKEPGMPSIPPGAVANVTVLLREPVFSAEYVNSLAAGQGGRGEGVGAPEMLPGRQEKAAFSQPLETPEAKAAPVQLPAAAQDSFEPGADKADNGGEAPKSAPAVAPPPERRLDSLPVRSPAHAEQGPGGPGGAARPARSPAALQSPAAPERPRSLPVSPARVIGPPATRP